MSWQFGKLEVTSLWPKRARGRNKNDRSCVLSLAINGHTVLLPGDISKVVERQLVHSGLTQHDVLAVPHHGSLSSSLPAFIDRVQPNLAVFSTGYLNRWSFPKDTVVARYQAAQSRPLNTACDGAVTLTFDGPSLQISTFRQAYPKWYYPNC
jgi:competence protein ComEC